MDIRGKNSVYNLKYNGIWQRLYIYISMIINTIAYGRYLMKFSIAHKYAAVSVFLPHHLADDLTSIYRWHHTTARCKRKIKKKNVSNDKLLQVKRTAVKNHFDIVWNTAESECIINKSSMTDCQWTGRDDKSVRPKGDSLAVMPPLIYNIVDIKLQ